MLRQIAADINEAVKALRKKDWARSLVHLGGGRALAITAAKLISQGSFQPSVRQFNRLGGLVSRLLRYNKLLIGRNGHRTNPPSQVVNAAIFIQNSVMPVATWLMGGR